MGPTYSYMSSKYDPSPTRVDIRKLYGASVLGSGLIDHSRKMTVAARVEAEKKVVWQRSLRVVARPQSLWRLGVIPEIPAV